ncbi:hypothetical protein [Limnofasciculus baicalensis]|uniref:Uncharacterized protein n=1 Tax=Limnofasciculus baicalensis BBK-W-15 TaxID=2699891 RepID=A0AAE3KKN8_9CYAN|nr:hypothetical protein [Limnofasciculus baicalensis]MCP2727304.1 hypothetical protein [Limnofasciculus baicalensis BBK-W-15]
MCLTCGCSDNAQPTLTNLQTGETMAIIPDNSKDNQRCLEYGKTVNPKIRIFEVSATTGVGLESWYEWLRNQ